MWLVWTLGCAADETNVVATADTATAPLDLAAWVARGVGPWAGEATDTPIGDLPFAITFQGTADGASGTADSGYGFSLTFSYAVDAAGRWTLTETGTLPGKFEQSQVLSPVEVDGDRVRWVTPDDPTYLQVDVTHAEDRLRMDTWVRGEPHAVLDLARVD
jgi:hypothetical protein